MHVEKKPCGGDHYPPDRCIDLHCECHAEFSTENRHATREQLLFIRRVSINHFACRSVQWRFDGPTVAACLDYMRSGHAASALLMVLYVLREVLQE
jgi:hypothetical protein